MQFFINYNDPIEEFKTFKRIINLIVVLLMNNKLMIITYLNDI
jgi:hypothetical protein